MTNASPAVPSAVPCDAAAPPLPPLPPPPPPAVSSSSRRRGHRVPSAVWGLLTTDATPYYATSSVCRHCRASVPHHHKSEKARAHLKRCTAFRAALDADATLDRPDWLTASSATSSSFSSSRRDAIHLPKRARTASSSTSVSVSVSVSSSTTSVSTAATRFAPPDAAAVADAVAMYVYTSGVPFRTIEDPFLRRAVTLGLPPPHALRATARDLEGVLLDRAFAAVQCELLRETQRPDAVNAICVNSWVAALESRQPHAAGSLYTVGAARPLFVASTPAVDEAHALFDDAARALTLCGDNIHGLVTDNSHAHQLMWAKFKPIFRAKFFHGCASHGLHLFLDQIFGVARDSGSDAASDGASDGGGGGSEAVPFARLRRLVDHCREIVEFFAMDVLPAGLRAKIAAKLHGAGLAALEMPLPGQWTKLKAGLESVLMVLPLLQDAMVGDGDGDGDGEPPRTSAHEAGERERVEALIHHRGLETLLFKAVALVDPLDALLRRLEQDPGVPISDVFYWFAKQLPVALSRVPGLTDAESAYLLKLNQSRFNAMYGDSHGMAYLLDPRYVGEGLSPEVRKNIEDLIFQTPVHDAAAGGNADELKVSIAQQLTAFVIDATQEKARNSFRYSILAKNKKTVRQFWLADGLQWPLLRRLALRLFSLPSSTVPMTKKVLSVLPREPRDELSAETRAKLRFIQVNQALLGAMKAA